MFITAFIVAGESKCEPTMMNISTCNLKEYTFRHKGLVVAEILIAENVGTLAKKLQTPKKQPLILQNSCKDYWLKRIN